MKFSVVMPIHNESDLLSLSLPSVYKLKPSEVILIFDNCSDDSEEIAKKIASKYDPLNDITVCIKDVPKDIEYKERLSYLMRRGMDSASCGVVLVTAADIILDSNIRKHMGEITRFPFMSFEYFDFPINWRTLIKSCLRFVPLWKEERLSGIYAVDLAARAECEDSKKVRVIDLGEDTLMQQCISSKYPIKFISSRNTHLRPKEDADIHYRRGLAYWKTAKRGFFKTVLSGIISGRPSLIRGYIHARMGGK
jgi:glycosyltransferase involved in cell wall biosynthesis